MPIRMLIVEDHEPTRELIREYLAQDARLEVVAETADGTEAVSLAKQHRPDIVLMDLMIEGISGLQATRQIKKACPTTEVIILTSYEDEDLKERARQSPDLPASAFLGKREIPTRLLWVIDSIVKSRGGEAESRNK